VISDWLKIRSPKFEIRNKLEFPKLENDRKQSRSVASAFQLQPAEEGIGGSFVPEGT